MGLSLSGPAAMPVRPGPESEVAKVQALAALHRQWGSFATLAAATLLAFYVALAPRWSAAGLWAAASSGAAVVGAALLWRLLPLNHRQDGGELLRDLGAGTRVTLLRGLGLICLTGFVVFPPEGRLRWLPALLYSLAALGDLIDGYLARRKAHTTELGARLDLELDGFGTLAASLLAVRFGQLPAWYLAVGAARYAFVLASWQHRRLGHRLHPLPESRCRRLIAGFQMGFLSAALWPIVPASVATLGGVVFATATLAGFLRDGLVVFGRLDPRRRGYRRLRAAARRAFFVQLPLLLRLTAAPMVLVLVGAGLHSSRWSATLDGWHWPWAPQVAELLALVAVTAGTLLALGWHLRIQAVTIAFVVCVDASTSGLNWLNGGALSCVSTLMLTGPGRLAAPRRRLPLSALASLLLATLACAGEAPEVEPPEPPIASLLRQVASSGEIPEDLAVVYDDMDQLHGGLTLVIHGDGRLERQGREAGGTLEGGEVEVGEETVRAVVGLLVELELWQQREPERPPAPDESQARVFILTAGARGESWEWYNELEERQRLVRLRDFLEESFTEASTTSP